ncbi:Hypothetical predicted protein, partial [Olea europaea subsp. europaea]
VACGRETNHIDSIVDVAIDEPTLGYGGRVIRCSEKRGGVMQIPNECKTKL